MKKFRCVIILLVIILFVSCKENKVMQRLVFINANGNSIDLTTDPYGITEWEGFSKLDLNLQTQQVPFHDGSVYLDGLLSERELSVTLAIDDNKNLEKRYRLRRELISILNPKIGEGVLIYTNNYISKQIKVVPQVPLFENHNANDSGTPKANLSWIACDPYWEDVEDTVVELTSGKRFTITNNGDVKCGFKAVLKTNSAQDLVLSNFTENKKIQLNGEINTIVDINTEFGQKNIMARSIKKIRQRGIGKIYSAVYASNLGYSCVVGDLNESMITDDWIKWDYYATDETMSKRCIVYSEEKGIFVVGLDSGSFGGGMLISVDGKNWSRYGNIDGNYNDGIYINEKNLFVFVGHIIVEYESQYYYHGICATSSDGQSWSETFFNSGTPINNAIKAVCYGNNIICATGYGGCIYTSSNGTTWSSRTSGINTILNGVCYSQKNNLFVACGASGRIVTSPDGITWTSRTSGVNTTLNKIIFSDKYNKFIICGNSGVLLESTDGITWTSRTSGTTNDIYNIKKWLHEEKIIIMGNNVMGYTTNGIDWIYTQGETDNYNWMCHDESRNLYVVVGDNGLIMTSNDCKNWTKRTSGVSNNLKCVAYNPENGMFFAVGDSLTCLYSEDGITWNVLSLSYSGSYGYADLYKIVYSSYYHCMFFSGDDNFMAKTVDGTSYEIIDTGIEGSFRSLLCVNERIMTTSAGIIVYSDDGVNWHDISIVMFSPIYLLYEKGIYLCVDSYGHCARSTDGLDWTIFVLSDVEYSGGLECAVYNKSWGWYIISGAKNYFFVSTDCVTWTTIDTFSYMYAVGQTNHCMIDDGDLVRVVGADGSIVNLEQKAETNIVNQLTNDSDMSISLEIGDNAMLVNESQNGNVSARIIYRQKYIGV